MLTGLFASAEAHSGSVPAPAPSPPAPPTPPTLPRRTTGEDELELGLRWLLAPAAEAPEWAARLRELELDDARALRLVRRLPLAALIDPVEAERVLPLLGAAGALADRRRLEELAALPLQAARDALAVAAARADRGELPLPCAASAWWWHGRLAPIDRIEALFRASLLPGPERASFARDAFTARIDEGLRGGREREVAQIGDRLAQSHPELPQLRLDAAAAHALAGDAAGAAALFEAAFTAEAARVETAALLRRGDAALGLAWLALAGGDPDGALEQVRRACELPRRALAQEDALHALLLRAAFVAACARPPPDDGDALAEALRRAPVDVTRSVADEAWFGPFGPVFGRELLRRRDAAPAWIAGARAIVAAIEASHDRHGHGVLARRPDDDESTAGRPAAWCFLTLAEALLTDAGDPAAARALAAPRIAALQASDSWSNHELAYEAQFVVARAGLYEGDGPAALAAVDAALHLARELRSGAALGRRERAAAGEPQTPARSAWIGRDDLPGSTLVARALLLRSGIRGTLLGDSRGRALDLHAAGEHWAWDGDRWLRHAVDFARRGRVAEARACRERVAATTERSYDLACLAALLGETDAALDSLARHLDWAGRSAAARRLELGYAARDGDLAGLRADPRFPRE